MNRQMNVDDRSGENAPLNKKEEAALKETVSGWSPRRILALAAVVLLAGLYLATFILAIAGNEGSARLLRFCFGLTIFLPIFIWVILWCIGYFRHKKNMASLNILNSNPAERERMEEAVREAVRDPEKNS